MSGGSLRYKAKVRPLLLGSFLRLPVPRASYQLSADRSFSSLSMSCPRIASPPSVAPKDEHHSENDQDSDSDSSDFEIIPETDSDRRRAMLHSDPTGNAKLKGSNGRLEDFWDEFIIPKASSSQSKGKEKETNIPSGATAKKDVGGLKQRTLDGGAVGTGSDVKGNGKGAAKGRGLVLGNIVQDEVEYRKKEALGMTKEQSEGRTLGGTKRPGPKPEPGSGVAQRDGSPTPGGESAKWACLICTL